MNNRPPSPEQKKKRYQREHTHTQKKRKEKKEQKDTKKKEKRSGRSARVRPLGREMKKKEWNQRSSIQSLSRFPVPHKGHSSWNVERVCSRWPAVVANAVVIAAVLFLWRTGADIFFFLLPFSFLFSFFLAKKKWRRWWRQSITTPRFVSRFKRKMERKANRNRTATTTKKLERPRVRVPGITRKKNSKNENSLRTYRITDLWTSLMET